jgi:ADP-heptose:LPS heptosyltransferase
VTEYFLFIASAFVSAIVNLAGALARRAPERVLIVKLDHAGDLVLATPAIRALRAAHPGARIDALVASGSRFVVQGSPHLTALHTYDSSRFRRGPKAERAGERPPFAILREVARSRYDTIVELRGDWWTLLLPFLSGATRRVDRGSVRLRDWTGRRGPTAGGTARGPTRAPLHEVETNLEVVRPLGGDVRAREGRPEVFPSAKAREGAKTALRAAGADLDRPIVCIHPGASWRPRAWRPERFAAVADWIQDHYHAQVVVLGSAEERDIEEAVRASSNGARCFYLVGTLSREEVVAVIARCALFVGNDSGLAHIAAACGVPSVVLFGPQNPNRFRPWGERSLVLHHPVPCYPCRQITCVRPESPCVNLIDVEEVKARVTELLGPPEPRS